MTAQARAADRWHMDTGERQALDDAHGEIRALQKWAEDFAKRQQQIGNQLELLHDRIGTLTDLIGSADRKTDLAMAEIRSIALRLDRLHGWADPQIRLERARAEVEADVLAKAARWRARLQIARPIAFFVLLLAFGAVALWVWIKTGINIVPLVTE